MHNGAASYMPQEKQTCGPQEVAWLTTFALTCITLVLAILCFRRGEHLRIWANQPWTSNRCKVLKTGVSYAGDCQKDLRTPYDYEDCTFQLSDYEKACFDIATDSYKRMGRLRRLHNVSAPVPTCHDSFLVWAYVHPEEFKISPVLAVEGESMGLERPDNLCGYSRGNPQVSLTYVFSEAVDLVDRITLGDVVDCWVLHMARPGQWLHRKEPPCRVVALDDPSGWMDSFSQEQWESSPGPLWFPCLALVFGMSAMMSATALCWCIREDINAWSALSYSDSPAANDSRNSAVGIRHQLQALDARREALRDRMDFFQRSILDEYRIVVSQREQQSARAWAN